MKVPNNEGGIRHIVALDRGGGQLSFRIAKDRLDRSRFITIRDACEPKESLHLERERGDGLVAVGLSRLRIESAEGNQWRGDLGVVRSPGRLLLYIR